MTFSDNNPHAVSKDAWLLRFDFFLLYVHLSESSRRRHSKKDTVSCCNLCVESRKRGRIQVVPRIAIIFPRASSRFLSACARFSRMSADDNLVGFNC